VTTIILGLGPRPDWALWLALAWRARQCRGNSRLGAGGSLCLEVMLRLGDSHDRICNMERAEEERRTTCWQSNGREFFHMLHNYSRITELYLPNSSQFPVSAFSVLVLPSPDHKPAHWQPSCCREASSCCPLYQQVTVLPSALLAVLVLPSPDHKPAHWQPSCCREASSSCLFRLHKLVSTLFHQENVCFSVLEQITFLCVIDVLNQYISCGFKIQFHFKHSFMWW
jgi:hypothetical protein